MSLEPGRTLGPYEITGFIGAGGMGEVYRARGARPGREVALKLLAAEKTADSGRLGRFLLEARGASALNYPHIVTVHDIGSCGGASCILMDVIEGRPLGKLIPSAALPLEHTLRCGGQVASAPAAGDRGSDIVPGVKRIVALRHGGLPQSSIKVVENWRKEQFK
jgi:serine/threonine protein kinase